MQEQRRHNFRQLAIFAVLVAATLIAVKAMGGVAHPTPARPIDTPADPTIVAEHPKAAPPQIEVVFVLDTTGSMAGLIDGAKQKIWSIASQLASGQPTPEIRMGLVAYRDRGDAYTTRVFDLTDDIDSVYSELFAFEAGGGGDTPESVNEALHQAVDAMQWSDTQNVYKVVFLVGDAPPHMDYQDDVKYPEVVRMAKARGIVINSIQCGGMPTTTTVWKQIASAGHGEFAAIAQDGGMVAMTTPVDERLAKLNRELAATAIAYGSDEDKSELERKLKGARMAPASVAASRLEYFVRGGKGRLNSGRKDLVDAVAEGDVDLDSIPEEALPAPMQAMAAPERKAFVEKRVAARRELQEEVRALAKKRDVYVRAETERRRAEGEEDGFDEKVLGVIRDQAAEAGIAY